MNKRATLLAALLAVLMLALALLAFWWASRALEANWRQPTAPSRLASNSALEDIVAKNTYPFTLLGDASGASFSPQNAANLGGAWALELCGMNLTESPVQLTYTPEDAVFFAETPRAVYEGRVTTGSEFLRYKIDAESGLVYSIEHCPYTQQAGLGSAQILRGTADRREALQKLTDFLRRQGKVFTLAHTQWGEFTVLFEEGGGLFARYDRYPGGIFLSDLTLTPSSDAPYPATEAGLQFSDFHGLEGVKSLDEQGAWAYSPREAYEVAARAAGGIAGLSFDAMACTVFGDGRDPDLPHYYGTCVFSDGSTAAVPEHLVYASDAISNGYTEATWSVDARTGHLLHLSMDLAQTEFPEEEFSQMAAQRARETLAALGLAGGFEVLKTGVLEEEDCSILVSDPEAPGRQYELWFYDAKGYPLRSLYYR